ncbi:riboflavin synthase subunit alpha [Flavobacteriales bacterium 34_180_T64]|nr:riboflavin synthase subunit alpha [Flavobacteriales bacterium 34_180_T64]
MFTGIIESLGVIKSIESQQDNLNFKIKSNVTSELKIDQSVSHNGVCLTVTHIFEDIYTVTAINETLAKTNLGELKVGELVNLERAMKLGDRLDGHMVQGHVDQTGVCKSISSENGSWIFNFTYDSNKSNITIEKGSITINGVSLTVVNSKVNEFSVAIIPYTYEHTNFKFLKINDKVNLEFDVIGKYIQKLYLSSK